MPDAPLPFVSRGGLKLQHALAAFRVDPHHLACADLGCSTGGFTDCLLLAGAARVVAVDTGYGILAWKLRKDPRVTVRERENALHALPRSPDESADLVVIDLGWTPQRLAIPAALRWLRPGGQIISLIKPHYEDKPLAAQHRGILPDDLAQHVARRILDAMPALGVTVEAACPSPIRGSGAQKPGAGNLEWLALLKPTSSPAP